MIPRRQEDLTILKSTAESACDIKQLKKWRQALPLLMEKMDVRAVREDCVSVLRDINFPSMNTAW